MSDIIYNAAKYDENCDTGTMYLGTTKMGKMG